MEPNRLNMPVSTEALEVALQFFRTAKEEAIDTQKSEVAWECRDEEKLLMDAIKGLGLRKSTHRMSTAILGARANAYPEEAPYIAAHRAEVNAA